MADHLLLVEDDPVLGPSLERRLVLEGFAVSHAKTLAEARAILPRRRPDVVLSDIRLPDGNGEALAKELSDHIGAVPMVFMTAFGDLEQAVRLLKAGARDYLVKPFDLDACVDKLKALAAIARPRDNDPFATFGLTDATAGLRRTLEKVAGIDLPVLILGETGTGKEVAARFLHAAGTDSKTAPFLAVNCGQLSADLADSTLFGHEKGAFTGAHQRQAGVFEEAGKGTLFLDEIGEIAPEIQTKLLRLLEDRRFRRLGGSADLAFEGRIVAATNRELEEAVTDGRFREDLWYRLNVVTVRLPPLRERTGEIDTLIGHFVALAAERFGRPVPTIDAAALAAAHAYDWPGNIRELRNRVERAVALAEADRLGAADLFPDRSTTTSDKSDAGRSSAAALQADASLAAVRDAAEREHIKAMLAREDGNATAAARTLGISRTTLWEKMRRLGIVSP